MIGIKNLARSNKARGQGNKMLSGEAKVIGLGKGGGEEQRESNVELQPGESVA